MKHPKVIVIAQNQPLDSDAHLRRKLADAEERAVRQSHRFPGLDLAAIQKGVHQNLIESLLFVDGRYILGFSKNSLRETWPIGLKIAVRHGYIVISYS